MEHVYDIIWQYNKDKDNIRKNVINGITDKKE